MWLAATLLGQNQVWFRDCVSCRRHIVSGCHTIFNVKRNLMFPSSVASQLLEYVPCIHPPLAEHPQGHKHSSAQKLNSVFCTAVAHSLPPSTSLAAELWLNKTQLEACNLLVLNHLFTLLTAFPDIFVCSLWFRVCGSVAVISLHLSSGSLPSSSLCQNQS